MGNLSTFHERVMVAAGPFRASGVFSNYQIPPSDRLKASNIPDESA